MQIQPGVVPLVTAYSGCLLATSMTLLGVRQRIDWRWGLASTLLAMPVSYLVLPPAASNGLASALTTNLDLVSGTQVLAQIAIVVAGAVGILTLLTSRRNWSTNTLWEYWKEWDGERMYRDRARTAQALIDRRGTADYLRVLNLFEQVGFLVHHRDVSVDDAWMWFSDFAVFYWIACSSMIEAARSKSPTYHEEFYYLVQRFKEIDERRNVPAMTPADVEDQLRYEAGLSPPRSAGSSTALLTPPV